uniref:DUF5320 domain-containing protein n=1 Tax=Desulfobacca acetoxidans TaxID=60893 RepID=A0A7V4G8I4_9BACT
MCHPGHGHGHGHGGSGCCTFGARGQVGPGSRCCHHTCCCCGGWNWRRYISPAEELERLHDYLAELKKEIAGVEARIHELKSK